MHIDPVTILNIMEMYATNIRITPVEKPFNWLAQSDFYQWRKSVLERRDWTSQSNIDIARALRCGAEIGPDHVVKWVDIDLPVPTGNINAELRAAIASIERYVHVAFRVTQEIIRKDVYEGTNSTTVDSWLITEPPNSGTP